MNKNSETPKAEPIHVQEYVVKQWKYDVCGDLPIRSVILGPSGSGETMQLQKMILDLWRDCFSRVFIFSPSIKGRHDLGTDLAKRRETHEGKTHRRGDDLLQPL